MTGSSSPARCWIVHDELGAEVEVEVRAPDGVDLGQVRSALAGAGLPHGPLWAGLDPMADATGLDDPRLRHGARLGSGRPGPPREDDGGAVELHVCAGPDAGRTLPLQRGRLLVGRGAGDPGRRLTLSDPAVSRAHLEIAVTASGVTVRDVGSVNGSRWQGAGSAGEVLDHRPAPWALGARVRLGTTSLRLVAPSAAAEPVGPGPGGRVLLTPRGRPGAPDPGAVTVPVPDDPQEPPRRAPAWVALLVPAVAGGVLALVLSSPQFLLFALLGPLVALGTWASDRWSGRRGHRRRSAEHAAALDRVDQDVAAALDREADHHDRAVPDLAVLATAARRRTAPLWGGPADRLTVRLGTGPGPTGVARGAAPVGADLLPVVLDLSAGGLRLGGPRCGVLGVARSVLCQLAVLHPPDVLALTVLTSPARCADWAWTRWLPHGGAVGTGRVRHGGRHLVVLDTDPTPEERAWLHRARAGGAVVVTTAPLGAGPGPMAVGDAVELQVVGETGGQGRLLRPGHPPRPLDLDLVGAELAALVAADLAPLEVPRGPGDLPDQVRWGDVVADPAPTWSRSRARLSAVLGAGVHGPVELDLCSAGPHAVVAGTTGAGKSELLRTLVLSLARSHPPDLCSFLLVDYKGGAAFAEATDLPHTVGVLTDLDGAATVRALQSLTAELTRRERLLAEHGARDVVELPDHVLLPRLVIVVDEFATLGEELPGFVPGLVGIAQRGRSLGVHLVLATQRPAGSVGPEIRANCTIRLCLRTVDEAGSREVLGLPDAAHLPVDRPGRALLRIGISAPVLLQVAHVGTSAVDPPPVSVRRRPWPDAQGPDAHGPGARGPDACGPGSVLAAEVARLRARAVGLPAMAVPPRPWLPPLPDRLMPLPTPPQSPTALAWGLVDRPDRQVQEPLLVDLAAGGGWLVLGGPGSGRTTALFGLLAAATGRLTPEQLHVHVVDHAGGGLADRAAGLPHTGTCVPRGDGHRLRRLLARLQAEVDRRRLTPGPHPHLLLLVDGLDAVAEAAEEVLRGNGVGAVLRLAREGAAVGLTAVLTADRVLPGSRLGGVAGRRLVLPLPDRADYPLAGVPVARVPAHRPPGRGLLGADAVEVQLALPGPLPAPGRLDVPGRIEVVELPADPPAPDLPPVPATGAPPPARVVIGPGGDHGAPVVVDLTRCGGLLVAGPPGSGRSSALVALGRRLDAAGVPVLRVAPSTRPEALPAWAAALEHRSGVVLADDLARLPDPLQDALAVLCTPGGTGLLVAAATPADVAAAFRGPAPALRRNRTALLLQPGRGDAELLGVRVPRDPLPVRPGAGWLVEAGGVTRVQVAR